MITTYFYLTQLRLIAVNILSISVIERRVLHLKGYFPIYIVVFTFSHHSTAFLVGTNSQCSSYIRHFFVYKAGVCQVVSPHKLKQKVFPAFDGAFFFYLCHFFFLCDAMWWRFFFLIRAPQAVYFFSVLLMVLIFNHHQNISLSYFLRRSHDLAFCCLVLISTFSISYIFTAV